MTTLTKVFIVILTVFAIAFSMLVMQYTLTATNYRELAESAQQTADNANKVARAMESQQKIRTAQLEKAISNLKEQSAELRTEFDKLATERTALQDELLAGRGIVQSLTLETTQLNDLFKTADSERRLRQDQLADTRKQLRRLQTENFRLAEINLRLEQDKAFHEKTIRLLRTRNQDLSETVMELRSSLQRAGTETAAAEIAPAEAIGAIAERQAAPIMGKISEIRRTSASISIGSAHGVKSGMEFIIFRGANYLGKLRITKVWPSQAAGELRQVQGTIRAGDDVADKL